LPITFALKKILGTLLQPLPLCLTLSLAGILLLWFSRRQRLGRVLVTIGMLSLAAFSCHAVSNRLLIPLERAYPIVDPTTLTRQAPQYAAPDDPDAIRWVVVLGGGHASDPKIPLISQLNDSSRTRLVEAVLFHRALPGSRLLLSGGTIQDPVPEAAMMADVARLFGVDESAMVLESLSRDTEDEASLIQSTVGHDRFLLVSSASHLKRAMALFEKRGMRPIAAPSDFQGKQTPNPTFEDFFPYARSLLKSELAIHELLGLAWARLKGSI
jgi:uncharacterized SAM-binding protein YcdF (DUF218 family)